MGGVNLFCFYYKSMVRKGYLRGIPCSSKSDLFAAGIPNGMRALSSFPRMATFSLPIRTAKSSTWCIAADANHLLGFVARCMGCALHNMTLATFLWRFPSILSFRRCKSCRYTEPRLKLYPRLFKFSVRSSKVLQQLMTSIRLRGSAELPSRAIFVMVLVSASSSTSVGHPDAWLVH